MKTSIILTKKEKEYLGLHEFEDFIPSSFIEWLRKKNKKDEVKKPGQFRILCNYYNSTT